MKEKQELKITTNRRVFNLLYKKDVRAKHGLCPYCNLHSGCNYWNRSKPQKNWKNYRKTQYRKMKKTDDFA